MIIDHIEVADGQIKTSIGNYLDANRAMRSSQHMRFPPTLPPSLQHTLCHVSAVSANRRRGIKIFSLLFLRNEREASAVPPPPPPQKRGARAKTSVAAARLHPERLGEKRGRKRGREAPSAVARASLGRRKEREREKEGERHRERLRRWLGPETEQAPTCATTGG